MEIISLTERPSHSCTIATWYHTEWVSSVSERTVDDVLEKISRNINLMKNIPHYYIAVDNEQLLGVVELKYRENENYPEYKHWLGGIYVAADSRGVGVGSSMIAFAKCRASELDVEDLFLQCDENLIDYYKSHDFSVCHGANHGQFRTTIMVCKLSFDRI